MSIASEITALNTNLTAAKNAVVAKGGTVGNTGLAGLATEIASIPSGGGDTDPGDYGRIWLRPWTKVKNVNSENCDVSVDFDIYNAYCKNNPVREDIGEASFDYDASQELWSSSSFDTPVEGIDTATLESDLGITVTNIDPEQMGYAAFFISKTEEFVIDYEADPINFQLTTEYQYNSLVAEEEDPELYTHVFHIGIMDIPCAAVTKFIFGRVPTSVPDYFLVHCGNASEINTDYWNVTTIGNYFLYGCNATNEINFSGVEHIGDYFMGFGAGYKQKIELPDIITIGNYFLNNDVLFNKTITFGNQLESIGSNFLSGCSRFNSDITFGSSMRAIGDFFLSGCTGFNSSIDLGDSLEYIGVSFLENATMFNQPITLPDTLTAIGGRSHIMGGFMYRTNRMVSAVDFGSFHPTIMDSSIDNRYFLTSNAANVPMYTQGVTIKGDHSSEWLSAYPNGKISTSYYRNLIDGEA